MCSHMIEQLDEIGFRRENSELHTMETILKISNDEKEIEQKEEKYKNEKENDRIGCGEALSEEVNYTEASN